MSKALKQALKPLVISLADSWGAHNRKGKHPRLWLLMYHRMLPCTDGRFQYEEPGMLVQPETFEMHIKELKQQFELVSLTDWISARARGEHLPDKACAITFDDGWADNYEYAFPVLKSESAPATLFAVADKIGTDFQFWPNIISMLLLSGAANEMKKHPVLESWTAAVSESPTADQIAGIIYGLKQFSDREIFNALAEIEWRNLIRVPMLPALMNWSQLREMKSSGLVEIGSHTCTHKRLTSALTQTELEYEIVQSKETIEKQLHSPVNLFCFPNGDYDDRALSLVEKHYTASVTTRRGINHVDRLALHELTRIGMHDEISCDRRLFRARLSGWI